MTSYTPVRPGMTLADLNAKNHRANSTDANPPLIGAHSSFVIKKNPGVGWSVAGPDYVMSFNTQEEAAAYMKKEEEEYQKRLLSKMLKR